MISEFIWTDEFQVLFETGLIKKAKEWDEGQGKIYRFPKELSSKMYSKKKPVKEPSYAR